MKNKTKLMCKDKTWDNIYMARLTQFVNNLLTDETTSNVSEAIKADLMALLEWQLFQFHHMIINKLINKTEIKWMHKGDLAQNSYKTNKTSFHWCDMIK